MKRESLEKRKLSAERIEEADEELFALEREKALKKGTKLQYHPTFKLVPNLILTSAVIVTDSILHPKALDPSG